MAMMLFSQCRKQGDDFRWPAGNQSNQPLISNANINAWVVKNPAMQYITLDWSKARQANIDGKNIVRVPTLNIDKSPANKTTSKIGTMGSSQDGDISNYYQEHPPEIFFVTDPNSSKPDSLQAYMLNFVPASRGAEFGQNGIWTGKLYDWDLNSPGLHVQEMAKNKVTSKYILRLQKQDVNDLSIGSNSVWTWLGEFFGGIGDAVWSAVNYIGFYLGITGSHIPSSNPGYMLVIGAWSSIDNGDGSGSTGGGSGASVTNSAGTTIYLNYLPGWGDVSNWQDYINVTLPRTPAVKSTYLINEPLEYEIVTDQTTGLSYSYSAIEEAFENNPELIEQIKADNSSATLPGPLINLSGIMFSQAYFKEAEITKIEHPDWSEGKIYAVALWNTIGGTTHFLLDVAGFVPVIGEAASLINGAIYFVEGDKINCALSLAAAIPVTGWVSIAGKWVKTTVSSVPIIEAAGKVAYKAVQVGKEMRLVKVAVSIFDYASIKALQAIKPADQTLTNLSRSLIDRFATRIAPTEPAMKTMIDDIVLNLDLQGTKTEALSEAMFQNANYVSHPAKFGSNNGFDGVFSVHISGRLNDPFEIVINESKQMSSVGSIKLNPQAGKAAQMSDVWIDQTIQEMRDYTSDLAVQQTGEYLYAHRALITKTVTCVDKTTGEIVLLKLTNY